MTVEHIRSSFISGAHLARIALYVLVHFTCAGLVAISLYADRPILCFVAALLHMALLSIRQSFSARWLSLTVYYTVFLFLSSFWIYYCLTDVIMLHPVFAFGALFLISLFVAQVMALPVYLYHCRLPYPHVSFSLALCLILGEYLRMKTFLALPYLNSASMAYSLSLFRYALPIGGVFLSGYLFLRVVEVIVTVCHGRYDKDARALLFLLLALCLTSYTQSYFSQSQSASPRVLPVHILQANAPLSSMTHGYARWEAYSHMLQAQTRHAIHLLPESVVGFHKQDMSISTFARYPFLNNSFMGITLTDDAGPQIYMVGTNQVRGTYRKQHLVPFGEYIPRIFRAFIPPTLFGYQFNLQSGPSKPELHYRDFQFYPMICYDLFFPVSQKAYVRAADAIVVSAENAYYRDSNMQRYFIRMAQIRALESSTPVLLAMNAGYSSHILADGTIHQQLPIHARDILKTNISPKTHPFFNVYHMISDGFVITLLCVFESVNILWTLYLRQRRTRQES